jgi:hypothetical protein
MDRREAQSPREIGAKRPAFAKTAKGRPPKRARAGKGIRPAGDQTPRGTPHTGDLRLNAGEPRLND